MKRMLIFFCWYCSISVADVRTMDPMLVIDLVPSIKKAAEAGDPNAQFDLSVIYAGGIGVDHDPSKARLWMRIAAENNHPEAQHWIAFRYYRGQNEKKDIEKAIHWYKKSAKGGYVNSMAMLGAIHNGVSYRKFRDLKAAKYWYNLASDNGHPYSAHKLGCYAFFAVDEIENKEKANELFAISAKHGHEQAEVFLETRNVRNLKLHCDLPRGFR